MPITENFLDNVEIMLNSIDESLAVNDQNSALKKTHECLEFVKHYRKIEKEIENVE